MKFLLALVLTQYIVHGYDDVPRHFTNGHGGYQFFHAAEYHNSANRRNDNDVGFSESIKYVADLPKPESAALTAEIPKPEVTVVPVLVKRLNNKLVTKVSNNISDKSDNVEDSSSENQILKETHIRTTPKPRVRFTTPLSTTTAIRRHQVTRKRFIVRKFKPQPKMHHKVQPEKNKKREISASNGNSLHAARKIPHKYKFTNRNFKPQQPAADKQKNNAQSLNQNRSSLYSRKPSDTFMQLHFRKLDVTTTTTTPSTMQGMKEKRHLANIRFFNRRKIRT